MEKQLLDEIRELSHDRPRKRPRKSRGTDPAREGSEYRAYTSIAIAAG